MFTNNVGNIKFTLLLQIYHSTFILIDCYMKKQQKYDLKVKAIKIYH